MQAIYKPDGTIGTPYDEAQHSHDSLMTVNLNAEQAANIEMYRVNPNTAELYLVPTVGEKYQKTVNNVILEMTQDEKDFVDLPQHYKKRVGGEWVSMTEVEKIAVLVANLREKRNQLLFETDYFALSDVTMTAEMTVYRQALRDLPENTEDVFNPVYPDKPK
jgi:hypothetical protein